MFSSRMNISESFRVMSQLRTQYTHIQYVEKISQQFKSGYHLCGLKENGKVISVAGFRFSNSLALGKHIYVEDFVTDETVRNRGYGKKLLEGIVEIGNESGVNSIVLDSGVQRFGAHQFYIKNSFDIKAYLMLRSLTTVNKPFVPENSGASCLPIQDERSIQSSFHLMAQLRPNYSQADFLTKIKEQQSDGYELLGVIHEGQIVALAGIRFKDSLAMGKYIYIEDFITEHAHQKKGHGGHLLNAIVEKAKAAGVDKVLLDSGVQRNDAHRFYYQHAFDIRAFVFILPMPHSIQNTPHMFSKKDAFLISSHTLSSALNAENNANNPLNSKI